MSTGPTHAMSGLLAWAAVTALAENHPIGQLSPQSWTVGAVLATGAALMPDIDHPSSTIARAFGPISQGLSGALNTVSSWVYKLTRTKRDSNREGGHRALTHTFVFALLCALGTTAVVQQSQKWALPLLMFAFAGLAVRGIMKDWSNKHDALLITVVSAGITALCVMWTAQTAANAAALGIAVAVGCVAHYIGDAITEQGCPMAWPIPIAGKTWYPIAPPKIMRMKTGGAVEMRIVGPAVTVGAVWLSLAALQNIGMLPFLGSFDLLPV
ncbi:MULTISPECIES: metal-dependent hydrolase [Actinosynnema]|uniref:Hydrolase n=1 Tax=Actinosynnema pretiosum TaxID=42197 RepID=A0A290ZEC1_9PSEU|nr:metal-dependent hydrolase [Actinosynnema pretiosum]ATE57324.1 hydrolase [Actinosynnema pretiosum]